MEVMSGLRHWISILNGYFNIKLVHTSVDGVIACVFWHTHVLGQVQDIFSSYSSNSRGMRILCVLALLSSVKHILVFLLYILVSSLSIFCLTTMAVLRFFLEVKIQLLLYFVIVYTKLLVLFMFILLYDPECVLNHSLQLIIRNPMNTTQTQGWRHTLFLIAL